MSEMKTCSRCNQSKTNEDFYHGYKTGHCKDCSRETSRKTRCRRLGIEYNPALTKINPYLHIAEAIDAILERVRA